MSLRSEFRDRVKADCRIVDLARDGDVAGQVRATRGGKRWTMLCPFHEEQTPSLVVDERPAGDLFHCFGCRAGGDVISWEMRLRERSYDDAVEALARRFGLAVPEWWGTPHA